MKKYRIIILVLLMGLLLCGCRMRIVESVIADKVIELETPEPTQTPEPTPTPTPAPEETPQPTPTPNPSETPKPSSALLPNPDDKQAAPDTGTKTVTPDQSGEIINPGEKVTVMLDPNEGTCGTASVSVTPGSVYGRLPDAKRSGYAFAGWYTAKTGGSVITENTLVTIAEDHTLYAHWTQAEAHTLTLDPNGGRLLRSETTRQVFRGETYGALPVPTRPGYDFIGWFTAADGGEQRLTETVYSLDADETLYAHWTYNPFAYWSFVLQNTNEALYACQKVSAYLEYDADHITPGYSPLLDGTTVSNAAANRGGGEVDDDWVNEKNPNVLVKCISDMSRAADAYAAMQARFPDRRILIVPQAAENGSAAQQLYYKLYFAQLMYPDWYSEMNIATVGAELGVDGSIYGS